MNRKEWIEYFEAINNRKPTIQECQQALLNGEFVMEGRQAIFSNNAGSVAGGAMPLPNQMVNQPYAQQMVFVKKKKFGKKTFIGLGIALFLIVATSLGLFLFSSKGTNLGGLWVNGNNTALVYEYKMILINASATVTFMSLVGGLKPNRPMRPEFAELVDEGRFAEVDNTDIAKINI